MKFIKKNWLIILIILLTIIRLLLSYKLPSFYNGALAHDDRLAVSQMISISKGNYLGTYSNVTLIKGLMYPLVMSISLITNMRYSTILTIIYILAVIYFTLSLGKTIGNKYILAFLYVFLLFNPLSYSSELFQRLYRNALTLPLILFFMGSLFRIVNDDKNKIYNYIVFGVIISIMFLTREDNIWVYVILLLLFIYKVYKKRSLKTIMVCITPIVILIASLNIVSYINYKHYGIYTYNEIQKSEFKNTYKKILQIKDDDKFHQVSIPRSTINKLFNNVDSLSYLNNKQIIYKTRDGMDEVSTGDIVWFLRYIIDYTQKFKSGKESEEFYKKVGEEIDELFANGTFEKEFIMPSIYLNVPTKEEIKEYPKDILKTIVYTTSYKNVKTFSEERLKALDIAKYDKSVKAYNVPYEDYHNMENVIEKNTWFSESVRVIYKWFTILFSILSIGVYIKNIKVKDKLNMMIHMTLMIYIIIICGVAYTNTTAYPSIRYCYLGSVYILQSIFIYLNMYRFYSNRTK